MSVLPLKTYASEGVPLFGTASGGTVVSSFADLTCSTITVNDGYIGLGGGHHLSTINGQLYYDLELLASQSSISSVADWSLFPAISTVVFAGENLQDVGAFNASTIRQAGATGASQTLTTTAAGATFSQAVSTASGTTLSTSVETTALRFQSAGNPIGTIALDSTLKGAYIVDTSLNTYTFSGGIFASDQVSTQKATVSSLVVNDIQAVTLTVQSTIHAISTISSAVILAESANFSTLWGQPSSFYQPYVPPDSQTFSSLTTSTIAANTGFFSSLTAQDISGTFARISSIRVGDISGGAASFSSINGVVITDSVKNWANYPAVADVVMNTHKLYSGYVPSGGASNDLNLEAYRYAITKGAGISNIADMGADIGTEGFFNVVAQGGNRGHINLTANAGFGELNYGQIDLTANGGKISSVGFGGLINIQANTPVGISNATSAVKINAAGVNIYAGALPAGIGSLAGYLFQYGMLGINQCVGLPSVIPNFPGTLYQYATGSPGYGGIRLESPAGVECVNSTDFYAYRIYPQFNPFAVGILPDLTIAGRTHLVQNTQFLSLSTVRNLDFGDDAQIGVIRGLSSINGQPISYYEPGSVSTVSTFSDLYTSSLFASTIVANNTVQVPALLTISSINGQPISYYEPGGVSTVSTFSDLYTSSLFASTITAETAGIFAISSLSSINGKPITDLGTSTFQTLYVESIRPSTSQVLIDTPANPGLGLLITSTGYTELDGTSLLLQTSTNSGGLYIADGQSTLLYSQLDLQLSALSSSKVLISGDSTIVTGPLFTSSFYISSINGQPISYYEPGGVSTISSFTDLYTSTLTVSTLSGFPDLSITGGVISGLVSTFSMQAGITQNAVRIFPNLTRITNSDTVSLYGVSTVEIQSGGVMTVETSKVDMDISPLYVSSLTVSSINGLPPGGSGGIQSLIGGNQINITNQSTINLNTDVAVSSLTASYFAPSTISTIIVPNYSNVFVPANSSTVLWPGSGPYAFKQTINGGTDVYRARTALSSFVYTLASNDYAPFLFDPSIPGNFAWFEIQLPGGGWGPYETLGVANIGGQYYIDNSPFPQPTSNLYFGSGVSTASTIITPGSSNFTYITPSSITTSTLYVSSINNTAYPPVIPQQSTISSFQTLSASSFTVSSINGFAYPIVTPTLSTFSTLYLTPSTVLKSAAGFPELQTLNSSNFSTGQVLASSYRLGGFVGDLNTGSYTRDTLNRAVYVDSNLALNRLLYTVDSNATISTISSVSISTATMATSSILFQAGLFSTLLFCSTPTTIGIASSMLYVDRQSDFSVGNNNILAGQMRIGFNQPAGAAGANRRAELVFYNQVKTEYYFSVQNQDRAIRTANTFSTLTAADEGYILDTRINPVIASTINGGTSTALMAWFPSSINSTIGISTMSIVPPLTYIAAATSPSTQTVLAANTPLDLNLGNFDVNQGGFTIQNSTITIPVNGTYEFVPSIQFQTTSGGPQQVDFWLTKNGNDLPKSGSRISVANNAEQIGTVSVMDYATAGAQYGLRIASSDSGMSAGFFPAQTTPYNRPAIPSVILNVKRVG